MRTRMATNKSTDEWFLPGCTMRGLMGTGILLVLLVISDTGHGLQQQTSLRSIPQQQPSSFKQLSESKECVSKLNNCAWMASPFCRLRSSYDGQRSRTISGRQCQPWSSQIPHKHNFTTLGDHNWCRNPDGDMGPWCFTTDSKERWEYCFQDCNACVKEDESCAAMGSMSCRISTAYNGQKNKTISGLPCKRWMDQDAEFSSMGKHNECRNPDNEHGPWCYVDHPQKRWEFCFKSCQGCKCEKDIVYTPDQAYGEIYSPRDTNEYCNDMNCKWTVLSFGSEGFTRIEFFHFSTETRVDYLDVWFSNDKYRFKVDRLMGTYEEKALPKFDFGPGTIEMNFKTDGSIVGPGFHAVYYRLKDAKETNCTCPTTMTHITYDPIIVQSPNFDGDGCENITCRYFFTADPGRGIEVIVDSMMINNDGSLELKDATDTSSVIANIAGNLTQSRSYQSIKENLMIVYHSGTNGSSKGFKALIRPVIGACNCDSATFRGNEGILTSPGFPTIYCPNMNCTWKIEVDPGKKVQIHVDTLSLPGINHRLIVTDPVTNFTHPKIFWPSLERGHVFTADFNTVTLRLITEFPALPPTSADDEEVHGFNISWTAVDVPKTCKCPLGPNSTSSALQGRIEQTACGPIDCLYSLVKNISKRNVICWFLYCRSTNENVAIGERRDMIVKEDAALIYFHSTAAAAGKQESQSGVILNFKWAIRNCSCGPKTIPFRTNGVLLSPNYPEDYCPNLNCLWILRAPTNHVIRLEVMDFITETFDRVTVMENVNGTSRVIAQMSGRKGSGKWTSSGPEVRIQFGTDTSVSYRGFRLKYTALSLSTVPSPSAVIPTDPVTTSTKVMTTTTTTATPSTTSNSPATTSTTAAPASTTAKTNPPSSTLKSSSTTIRTTGTTTSATTETTTTTQAPRTLVTGIPPKTIIHKFDKTTPTFAIKESQTGECSTLRKDLLAMQKKYYETLMFKTLTEIRKTNPDITMDNFEIEFRKVFGDKIIIKK